MHRRYWLLTVLCTLIVFLLPLAAQAVKLNSLAPDFTLKDLQGGRQSLSAYRGNVVILNFWSTTCAPCVVELPSLNDLHRELKGQGLTVLGIALDPSEKPVRELTTKLKIGFPTMSDSGRDVYFDSYGLFGQPVSVIVDRSGLVREKIIGAVEWTSPQMRTKIQTYLKGR